MGSTMHVEASFRMQWNHSDVLSFLYSIITKNKDSSTYAPHCTCMEPTSGLSQPMACSEGKSSLSSVLRPRKFSFSKISMRLLW